MNLIKLLTMVSLFKDVTKEVQAAGREKRPWYLQRTVWGALVAALGGVSATLFGVTLDPQQLAALTDNIPGLITAVVAVYGAILSSVGAIIKAKKAAQK